MPEKPDRRAYFRAHNRKRQQNPAYRASRIAYMRGYNRRRAAAKSATVAEAGGSHAL